MRVAIQGTEKEIAMLREKLNEWIQECETLANNGECDDDAIAYAGLIAFFPQADEG